LAIGRFDDDQALVQPANDAVAALVNRADDVAARPDALASAIPAPAAQGWNSFFIDGDARSAATGDAFFCHDHSPFSKDRCGSDARNTNHNEHAPAKNIKPILRQKFFFLEFSTLITLISSRNRMAASACVNSGLFA
jgi:hypothetical protein